LKRRIISESYHSYNATPNNKTGFNMTPCRIVTGKKPIIPAYEFGQIGITNARRGDEAEQRAEYGIFLNNMYNSQSHYKVYVPNRRHIYSKRTFVPTTNYPAEWNLVPRMKDLNDMIEIIDDNNDEMSTNDVILMNSSNPEGIAQSKVMQNEVNRLTLEKSSEPTTVMRGNDLVNVIDNDADHSNINTDVEDINDSVLYEKASGVEGGVNIVSDNENDLSDDDSHINDDVLKRKEGNI